MFGVFDDRSFLCLGYVSEAGSKSEKLYSRGLPRDGRRVVFMGKEMVYKRHKTPVGRHTNQVCGCTNLPPEA